MKRRKLVTREIYIGPYETLKNNNMFPQKQEQTTESLTIDITAQRSGMILVLILKNICNYVCPHELVHSGYGMDNYLVAAHMTQHRGPGRSRIITE